MKTDVERIITALRAFPEYPPPRDIADNVMSGIMPRKTLRTRLKTWLTSSFTFTLTPLRLSVYALSAVFLITIPSTLVYYFSPGQSVSFPGNTMVSDNASANFQIGQGLLKADLTSDALVFLDKASSLDPRNEEYSFWKGIAYWENGDLEMERTSYLESISINSDYLPAILNLGNNFLQAGDYHESLLLYKRVLEINPFEKQALYNLALTYRLIGDIKQEEQALISYLSLYRKGQRSLDSLERLQEMNNYRFRKYLLGNRIIIVDQANLLETSEQIQKQEIAYLYDSLAGGPPVQLNFIIYCTEKENKAEQYAKTVLNAVSDWKKGEEYMLTMSWFDTPDPYCQNHPDCNLKKSVLIFGTPDLRTLKERTI
ncbi:MAG: tetratricopeptide repeat protein [Bacteroidetes bacterium]|nr:tetratricopeptide repeat protein [Bacteroidota bacterium]